MTKNAHETKSLVYIVLVGYIVNLVFGWLGASFANGSAGQVVLYQVGDAFAIFASVMAGRYAGLRGEHVTASAYILLGIAHGISLAALGKEGIDLFKESTMAMPMVPALVFMCWCTLFPLWLRMLGLVPALCFAWVYVSVHLVGAMPLWVLYAGYGTLQFTEVVWGIYFFKDWKRTALATSPN